MKLYIQIRNGQPFEHPIVEDNFREAFPHIDLNNLPPEFAEFRRLPQPIAGPYEGEVLSSYEWDGSVVTDAWIVERLPEEEIARRRQALTERVGSALQEVKDWTQTNIDNASGDTNKQLWVDYMATLNNFNIQLIVDDPVNVNLPIPPY